MKLIPVFPVLRSIVQNLRDCMIADFRNSASHLYDPTILPISLCSPTPSILLALLASYKSGVHHK